MPTVHPNDNRVPAGHIYNNILTLRLVVQMARWSPEAKDGPFADVAAFAEEGHAPQVPGPLIRVPTGTTIDVTVRNALADSTVYLHGFTTKPARANDSIAVLPGETRSLRFAAGAPGTYLYWATAGTVDTIVRERDQLAGAFVIDDVGARTDDRIFVMDIWGEPRDSVTYPNALAINGKTWPYTERIMATVGDSLRWRVINGTSRNHPMHLHGFYFRVSAHGTALRDSQYPAAEPRVVVTEDMSPGETMRMAWQASRPGNWLFHCHITFHVTPGARLEPPLETSHAVHADDPRTHMAGLVLGIQVKPSRGWVEPPRLNPRRLHLFVNEGPQRGHAKRSLGFVLQNGDTPPAADSVERPGSTLILTQNEPTDITVVNRLAEATAIHWHGIELESFSDGVAGWSGALNRLAPVIAARDSFTARLTLPRAGTFMYHTHLNDLEQITSGLYGAIVVLEPGRKFDPSTDHVFVVGWDGRADPLLRLMVNGDSAAAPLELAAGVAHRFRFVNIGPAQRVIFAVRRDSATVLTWRPLAKDGANLPARQAVVGPARKRIAVGETFDAEFTPPAPGEYLLTMGKPANQMGYVLRLIVR